MACLLLGTTSFITCTNAGLLLIGTLSQVAKNLFYENASENIIYTMAAILVRLEMRSAYHAE